MGNACCAGAKAAAVDAAADAKAAAARAMANREAAAAEALVDKIADVGAKIDDAVMKERGVMRGVFAALSALIIDYKRVSDGDPTLDVPNIPPLAVWAKSPAFCGNDHASEGIHLASGRFAMIVEGRTEFYAGAATEFLEGLNEAKEELRSTLALIDVYIKAELDLPPAKEVLSKAADKLKDAEGELKGLEDAALEKAEAVVTRAEGERDKAQEKLDELTDKAKEAKEEALAASKGGSAGVETIKKACETLAKGYAELDAGVVKAAAANAKSASISGYEPSDAAASLAGLGIDLIHKGNAAANMLTASKAELNKLTSAKMSEAKRLLTLSINVIEAWSKEEATHGVGSMHGPREEGEKLKELVKALPSEESGAKAAVSELVLTDVGKRVAECAKASEKFVDVAKDFLEGLTPVAERLKEYEVSFAAESKPRSTLEGLQKQVPPMKEKLDAADAAYKEAQKVAKEAAKGDDEAAEKLADKQEAAAEKAQETLQSKYEALTEKVDAAKEALTDIEQETTSARP